MESVKTWGEALDWVWKNHWRRLNSARTNQINAGHITAFCGRSMPLARMAKPAWWIQMIAQLQDEHPEWSTSTVNRVTSAGTTVLRMCHKAELTTVTVPAFDRLKEGEHRLTWFSKEQVESMAFAAVDVFDRQDLADALLFAAYTGARQAELLKLRVEDVDWGNGNVWFGGKPGRITKGKNVRAVPIHERISPILRRRTEASMPSALVFGCDWTNKDQLYGSFKKVRDYCKITDDHVWHSLRHSFGTWVGEVAHPRQIMALMGHRQVETSLRYVKATDSALRTAIAAI
jgi:integrase